MLLAVLVVVIMILLCFELIVDEEGDVSMFRLDEKKKKVGKLKTMKVSLFIWNYPYSKIRNSVPEEINLLI